MGSVPPPIGNKSPVSHELYNYVIQSKQETVARDIAD